MPSEYIYIVRISLNNHPQESKSGVIEPMAAFIAIKVVLKNFKFKIHHTSE